MLISGQSNLSVPGAHVSRTPSTTITTKSTARSPRASPSPARASSTSRAAPRSVSRGRPTEARKVSQRKPSSQTPYTGDIPTIKTDLGLECNNQLDRVCCIAEPDFSVYLVIGPADWEYFTKLGTVQ